ncbi:MAG: hypothetical protein E7667_03205 [Ruminococcaceae bacterium]|nr:hypothetical protein [Oscillospiraceae bacterium]
MIITFCGHSNFIPASELEQKMFSIFENEIGDTYAELYLGGYGNFDSFALSCGRHYKQAHPNVKLIFVTPYLSLSYQENHLKYNKLLYDEIIYPEIENAPPKFAISYRNKWMVEKADLVIAYVKNEQGGAYKTCRYAQRKNKRIFNLANETCEM